MRKLVSILLVAAMAIAGTSAAGAQVRIQAPVGKPYVMVPRAQKAPRVPRVTPVVPKLVIIKPSQALSAAMRAVPNAKPLGVRLKNQTYIVRLKQGGTITQLGVNSVTGAVTRLP
jgi:hypothetical protein